MDAVVYGKVAKLEKLVVDLQKQLGNSNKGITVKLTTTSVSAGYSHLESPLIDVGSNKLLIKSIYIEGAPGSKIDIEIVSSKNNTPFLVYKNVVASHVLYDILDLPYEDEDGTNCIHLRIKNDSTLASSYKVRITGVTLR